MKLKQTKNKRMKLSSFLTILFLTLFWSSTSFAQYWQETYGSVSDYTITSLSEANGEIELGFKNNLSNEVLKVESIDGGLINLMADVPDCPSVIASENYRISQTEYVSATINTDGNLEVKRIRLNATTCELETTVFSKTYNLPVSESSTVSLPVLSIDGQFIFVGGTNTLTPVSASTEYNFYIKKIDAQTGEEIWSYSNPNNLVAIGTPAELTIAFAAKDGGCFATSSSQNSTRVTRIGSDGDFISQKVVGGSLTFVTDLKEANDGGLIANLFTVSPSGPGDAPRVEQYDANGDLVLSSFPSTTLFEFFDAFFFVVRLQVSFETSDGSLLLAGINEGGSGTPGYYIMRVDQSGTRWVQFFENDQPNFEEIIETTDGDFILAGTLNDQLFLTRIAGNIAAPCTNLLTNGDFENGFGGWNVLGNITESNNGVNNSIAANICGVGSNLGQLRTTTPGTSYTATGFGRVESTDQILGSYVLARFLTSSYQPINDGQRSKFFNTNTEFQPFEFGLTAPANAAFVQVLFWNENSGCLIVDDVELCESDALLADLSIGNLNISNPTVTAGEDFNFGFNFQNIGLATADGAFQTSYYLSATPEITVNSILIGSITVTDFTPNASQTQNATPTIPDNIASGDYYLIVRLDDLEQIEESDESNNTVFIPIEIVAPPVLGSGVDLELSISQSIENPAPYSNYSVTLTLNNTGDADAMDVLVAIPNPNGVVYQGGNEYEPLTEDFDVFGSGIWNLGTVAAGTSASLKINYFLLSPEAPISYAQVSQAVGDDVDSTPGNGTPPIPNEDDEASTSTPNTTCSLSVDWYDLVCIDPATPNDPSDDQFGFSFVVTGTNASATYTARIRQDIFSPLAYGEELIIDGPSIADGSVELIVFDQADESCRTAVEIDPPTETCSGSTTNLPDLILKNLSISNDPVTIGEVLNYKVDIDNVDLGQALGSVSIRAYFSTDATLSSDDLLGGNIGAFFDENTTFPRTNIPGGTMIGTNGTMLNPGDYYLILEVDELEAVLESNEQNNTITAPFTVLSPSAIDLFISNLEIPAPEVDAGQVLNYNFDLSNIGTENALGDFNVKAWISVDELLTPDDIQDGMVPTGNFDAGLLIEGVAGASTIPANLAAGDYFIILKVDGEDQFLESDELNNFITAPFTVRNNDPTFDDCENAITSGNYQCFEIEQNEVLSVVAAENGMLFKTTMDTDGVILATEDLGPADDAEPFIYFSNGQLIKRVGGMNVLEVDVPTSLSAEYEYLITAMEYEDGFIVFAYKSPIPNSFTPDSLFAIRTDIDLQPIFANFLATAGEISGTFIRSPIVISDDRIAFIYNVGPSTNQNMSLVVIDDLLNLKSRTYLENSFYSGSGTIKPSKCGEFEVNTQVGLYFCIHGSCSVVTRRFGAFEGDVFIPRATQRYTEISTYGQGTRTKQFSVALEDESVITALHTQDIGFNFVINPTVILQKIANGQVVWEETVDLPNPNILAQLIEQDGKLYFLAQDGEMIERLDVECFQANPSTINSVDLELSMNTANPAPSIYSVAEVELTVTNTGNLPATNIAIDFPKPAGVVYSGGNEFTVTEGTFKPYGDELWKIETLDAGASASVTMRYFIVSNEPIRPYAQVIVMNETDVDSSPANGTCCTPEEDDEASLTLNSATGSSNTAQVQRERPSLPIQLKTIIPNPTMNGKIDVVIYSKEAGFYELQCYSLLGKLEQADPVGLQEGWNRIPMDVSKLTAGTYFLQLPGHNWRKMPTKFVVVRD